MTPATAAIPRHSAVFLLWLAGCAAEPPASLLLTVTASGSAAPEAIQVRTFDGGGLLQAFTRFPSPAPGPDGRLGTVVIYPARGGDHALRVQAQGLRGGGDSEGTARAMVTAGRQETATLTLGAPAADADRDGVPDAIDNCPALANEKQEDGDHDGRGDDCAPAGGPDAPVYNASDTGATVEVGCNACERPPEPKPAGTPCAVGAECRSSFCTDGVCCEAGDCGGLCRSCNLPGAAGTCGNIPLDGAPRAGGCPAEPASACGRTGKCDGAGACQRQPAGASCAPGRCNDATEVAASTCATDGRCMAGQRRACADGFSCKGDTCATACTTEAECAETHHCVTGSCKPRIPAGSACEDGAECLSGFCADGHCCGVPRCADGAWCGGPGGSCLNKKFNGDPAPCAQGYECNSGFCADGVCCESACTDACRSCGQAGMIGKCVALGAGVDMNASSPCAAPKRCQAGVCR